MKTSLTRRLSLLIGIFYFLPLSLFAGLQTATERTPAPSASPTPTSIVVASYNVENYFPMPRIINGQMHKDAGKPESEKQAVAKVIAGIHPDIIGFMEMGDMRQFTDLQHHLHEVGLDYKYSKLLQGFDPERHIALLSHFPIIANNSEGSIPLQVNGETLHSPRGIIDVTLQLEPNYQLRVLCVHLKSKVNDSNYSPTALREAEAKHLRSYISSILTKEPKTHLLLMGDYNDTKNSPTITEILGTPTSPDSLEALSLTDERGEFWTEFWNYCDIYSRIDYMIVSKSLKPSILMNRSGIARPTFWNEASDHCALFTTIAPQEKE